MFRGVGVETGEMEHRSRVRFRRQHVQRMIRKEGENQRTADRDDRFIRTEERTIKLTHDDRGKSRERYGYGDGIQRGGFNKRYKERYMEMIGWRGVSRERDRNGEMIRCRGDSGERGRNGEMIRYRGDFTEREIDGRMEIRPLQGESSERERDRIMEGITRHGESRERERDRVMEGITRRGESSEREIGRIMEGITRRGECCEGERDRIMEGITRRGESSERDRIMEGITRRGESIERERDRIMEGITRHGESNERERDRNMEGITRQGESNERERDSHRRRIQNLKRGSKRTSEVLSLENNVKNKLKKLRTSSKDIAPSRLSRDYNREQMSCNREEETPAQIERPRSSENTQGQVCSNSLEKLERSVSLERSERSEKRRLSPVSKLNKTVLKRKHQNKKSDRRNGHSSTPQTIPNDDHIPVHINTAQRDRSQNLYRGRDKRRHMQNGSTNFNNAHHLTGWTGGPYNGDHVYRGPPSNDVFFNSVNDQNQISNFQPAVMVQCAPDETHLENCNTQEREDFASDILGILCGCFDGKTDLQKLRHQLFTEGILQFSNTRSLYVFLKKFEVFHMSGDNQLDTVEEGEVVDSSSYDAIIIEGIPNLQLCITHSEKAGSCNKGCKGLHICKYYMLSKCEIPEVTGRQCLFGHDLCTEHNKKFMRQALIHRFRPHMLLQPKYRNPSTVPLICDFYNRPKGCGKPTCQFLHICEKFILSECQLNPPCNLTHDLQHGQARDVLSRYGIAPTNAFEEQYVVNVLNRIELERKFEPSKCSKRWSRKETQEFQKSSDINRECAAFEHISTSNQMFYDTEQQFDKKTMMPSGLTKDPSKVQPFAVKTTTKSVSEKDVVQEQAWFPSIEKTLIPSGPNIDNSREITLVNQARTTRMTPISCKGYPKQKTCFDPDKKTMMPRGPNRVASKEQQFVNSARTAMTSGPKKDRQKEQSTIEYSKETMPSAVLRKGPPNGQLVTDAALKALSFCSPPEKHQVGDPTEDTMPSSSLNKDPPNQQPVEDADLTTLTSSGPSKKSQVDDPTEETMSSSLLNTNHTNKQVEDSALNALTSSCHHAQKHQDVDPTESTMPSSVLKKNPTNEQPVEEPTLYALTSSGLPRDRPVDDPPEETMASYVLKKDFLNEQQVEDSALNALTSSGLLNDHPVDDSTKKTMTPSFLKKDPSNQQPIKDAAMTAFTSPGGSKKQSHLRKTKTPWGVTSDDSDVSRDVDDEDLDATDTTDWEWAWKAEDGDWNQVDDCCHFEEQFRGYLRAQRMRFFINRKSSEINFLTMKGRILGESPLQFRRVKKEQAD